MALTSDLNAWAQLIAVLGLVFAIVKVFGKLLLATGKIVQRLDDHEMKDDERHNAQSDRITRLEEIMMKNSWK